MNYILSYIICSLIVWLLMHDYKTEYMTPKQVDDELLFLIMAMLFSPITIFGILFVLGEMVFLWAVDFVKQRFGILALCLTAALLSGCATTKTTTTNYYQDGELVKQEIVVSPAFSMQYYYSGFGVKIGVDPQTRIPIIWVGYISGVMQWILDQNSGSVNRDYDNVDIWSLSGNVDIDMSVTPGNTEPAKSIPSIGPSVHQSPSTQSQVPSTQR